MIINDKKLKDLALNEGMISPFEGELVREKDGRKVISYGLSSYGYDIRLSSIELKVFSYENGNVNDPKNFKEDSLEILYSRVDKRGEFFILPAHGYALGVSVEKFDMPSNVTGICTGKSTYARSGIIANITPLEAGWRGYLTLEIANTSNIPCKIYANEGIAQVLFFSGDQCQTSYSNRNGKYLDQPQSIVLPIV